ncbi:uncharacterized protein [Amphiura filiformis]|uniref:uncharacterized protein n=1 Tax=Amphiura filiformis TaxID=82378 RepID=UPI003B20BF7D
MTMACKTTFYLLALCICVSFIFHVCDADAHTQGQDFVFSIPAKRSCSPYILLTATSKSAVVTVTVLAFREQYLVGTTNVVRVVLPPSACVRTSGVNDQSINVHSTNTISVHVFSRYNHGNYGGDGFLAIPTGRLGLTYYIATYQPSSGDHSFIAISSLDITTTIEITPRHESTTQVTIRPYETYVVHYTNIDPTGTHLNADHPISVVAGSGCYDNNKCLPLFEQLPPVEELGWTYFVGPFKGRNSGYACHIIGASDIPTNIQISNRDSVQLNSGDIEEIEVRDNSLLEISADNPVLVMQYMKPRDTSFGIPSMVLVTSVDQFSTNISFPVSELSDFTYYVHVSINCLHKSDLFFDGKTMADWEVLRNVRGSMCLLRKRTTSGLHNLGHRENAPFNAIVYGYKSNTAYAYPAGFNLHRGPASIEDMVSTPAAPTHHVPTTARHFDNDDDMVSTSAAPTHHVPTTAKDFDNDDDMVSTSAAPTHHEPTTAKDFDDDDDMVSTFAAPTHHLPTTAKDFDDDDLVRELERLAEENVSSDNVDNVGGE